MTEDHVVMKHNRTGNCWFASFNCWACSYELCTVCHEHEQPRGRCMYCDPCLACEESKGSETSKAHAA
jgi:hypothetical protein